MFVSLDAIRLWERAVKACGWVIKCNILLFYLFIFAHSILTNAQSGWSVSIDGNGWLISISVLDGPGQWRNRGSFQPYCSLSFGSRFHLWLIFGWGLGLGLVQGDSSCVLVSAKWFKSDHSRWQNRKSENMVRGLRNRVSEQPLSSGLSFIYCALVYRLLWSTYIGAVYRSSLALGFRQGHLTDS